MKYSLILLIILSNIIFNNSKDAKSNNDDLDEVNKACDAAIEGSKSAVKVGLQLTKDAEKALYQAGKITKSQRMSTVMKSVYKAKDAGQILSGVGYGVDAVFRIAKGVNIANDENLSKNEKEKEITKVTVGAASNIGGGIAGAKVGALIGAVGGPIGATIWGVIGSLVGGWLGEKTSDAVIDEF